MRSSDQGRKDVMERLAEVAGWHTSTRDDARVVAELHNTKVIDSVHALDQCAFFDEFFQYVRDRGLWSDLEGLDPKTRKGPLYPFIQFVTMTIMRCVGGVQSMLAMHDVLLTDEALMAAVGFNADQVKYGANQRGEDRRKEPVEIQGALSYETIADNLVTIELAKLEKLFNAAIHALAAQGVFPKKIDAVLDATDDEATPTYVTDGGGEVPHVRREKRPDVRANRRAKKVEVTVYGWKVWVVWEPTSKVPLAIKIDAINVADNTHALAVLLQARDNVRGYATVCSVALDRGFLDGKLLSAIEREQITIYIPARTDMHVTREAREIAGRAVEAHAHGATLDGVRFASRDREVTHGAGKNARKVVETTELVLVEALDCDWWGQDGDRSKSNAKNFVPHKIRAVVVMRWDGALRDDDREVVFLTTDASLDPFVAFDAYDDRSLIENTCNREAKERWWLEHHPKRSEAGVRVQAYFVFLCMALVAGFRAHRSASDAAERRGQDTGIARYRRQLATSNRDRLLVIIGAHYAVLRSYEFALLLGVSVRDRKGPEDTVDGVLRRYGVPVVAPNTS
jgi:Transposase DDE domain